MGRVALRRVSSAGCRLDRASSCAEMTFSCSAMAASSPPCCPASLGGGGGGGREEEEEEEEEDEYEKEVKQAKGEMLIPSTYM